MQSGAARPGGAAGWFAKLNNGRKAHTLVRLWGFAMFDQNFLFMAFLMLCFAGLATMFYFMMRNIDELTRTLKEDRNQMQTNLRALESSLNHLADLLSRMAAAENLPRGAAGARPDPLRGQATSGVMHLPGGANLPGAADLPGAANLPRSAGLSSIAGLSGPADLGAVTGLSGGAAADLGELSFTGPNGFAAPLPSRPSVAPGAAAMSSVAMDATGLDPAAVGKGYAAGSAPGRPLQIQSGPAAAAQGQPAQGRFTQPQSARAASSQADASDLDGLPSLSLGNGLPSRRR